MAPKIFKANNNEIIKDVNSKRANKIIQNLSKSKKLKNKIFEILIRFLDLEAMGEPIFLTFNTKKVFNYLRQAFIEALIL